MQKIKNKLLRTNIVKKVAFSIKKRKEKAAETIDKLEDLTKIKTDKFMCLVVVTQPCEHREQYLQELKRNNIEAVYIEALENPKLVHELSIKYSPTTFFFQDGNLITFKDTDRVEGYYVDMYKELIQILEAIGIQVQKKQKKVKKKKKQKTP